MKVKSVPGKSKVKEERMRVRMDVVLFKTDERRN